jgi:hypothetical protein
MIKSLLVVTFAFVATANAEPQFNVFGGGNRNRFQPTFSRPSTTNFRPASSPSTFSSQPTFSRPAPVSAPVSSSSSGGATVQFGGQVSIL